MTVWVNIGDTQRRVVLPDQPLDSGAALKYSVDGKEIKVDARLIVPGILSLVIDGKQFRCILDRDVDGEGVILGGERTSLSIADPRSLTANKGAAAGTGGPRQVKAPMPGRVVRVLAALGDEVVEGQGLIVIEAMKMQNELRSPRQGRVSRLSAEIGATVVAGEVLIVVE